MIGVVRRGGVRSGAVVRRRLADRIEVSGHLLYLFNFRNPDTHYTSGQEVSFDYGVGYTLRESWQVEGDAKNRPQGNRFMLQIALALF